MGLEHEEGAKDLVQSVRVPNSLLSHILARLTQIFHAQVHKSVLLACCILRIYI